MIRRLAHRAPTLAAIAALGAAVASCFNPFSPRVASNTGVSSPPPAPTTPQGVVRLFEWCWNNRDEGLYKEIFTEDFQFKFAAADTAGSDFRNGYSTREDEMIIAHNLFVSGSATRPPATSISLSLDPNLIDTDPVDAGKDPKWHRVINTQVNLRIITDEDQLNVQGQVTFKVVRGDSALIPVELQSRFRPDSTRWWIERWEDYTIGDPAGTSATRLDGGLMRLGAVPSRTQAYLNVSYGRAKLVWYDGPVRFAAGRAPAGP